eukprot:XP_001709264.1 Hypothetical protein GL50803_2503 [Giardia lamblia ATCC 50803]
MPCFLVLLHVKQEFSLSLSFLTMLLFDSVTTAIRSRVPLGVVVL